MVRPSPSYGAMTVELMSFVRWMGYLAEVSFVVNDAQG